MWSAGAKSLASLCVLGVRAVFAFLALSQAVLSWVSDLLFTMFMDEISRYQKVWEGSSLVTLQWHLGCLQMILFLLSRSTPHWNSLLFPNMRLRLSPVNREIITHLPNSDGELHHYQEVVVKGIVRVNSN